MIPFQAIMLPVYLITLKLHLVDSVSNFAGFTGLIMPFAVSAFGIFLMRQAFLGIPKEMEEAAIIDGCSVFQVFSKVLLPMVKPSLAVLAIFTFIGSWGEFLWPSIVLTKESMYTLPVGVNNLQGMFSSNWRFIAAGSILATIPILIFFLCMQNTLYQEKMTVQLRVSVEKVFVIFALLFGMLYAIITPPFQSVDEANHFLRSYAITEGQIVSTKQDTAVGSVLPASLLQLVKKFQYLEKDITKQTSFKEIKNSFAINNNSKIFTTYPNTALYSPAAYIAQSAGILCGKILHTAPLSMFYLARIFNLILYCILGYYAIKCTPF